MPMCRRTSESAPSFRRCRHTRVHSQIYARMSARLHRHHFSKTRVVHLLVLPVRSLIPRAPLNTCSKRHLAVLSYAAALGRPAAADGLLFGFAEARHILFQAGPVLLRDAALRRIRRMVVSVFHTRCSVSKEGKATRYTDLPMAVDFLRHLVFIYGQSIQRNA
jgi:hypothetical protein